MLYTIRLLFLLDVRFEKLWHALIFEAPALFLLSKISNLDSLQYMHFSFGYVCKRMHVNTRQQVDVKLTHFLICIKDNINQMLLYQSFRCHNNPTMMQFLRGHVIQEKLLSICTGKDDLELLPDEKMISTKWGILEMYLKVIEGTSCTNIVKFLILQDLFTLHNIFFFIKIWLMSNI